LDFEETEGAVMSATAYAKMSLLAEGVAACQMTDLGFS